MVGRLELVPVKAFVPFVRILVTGPVQSQGICGCSLLVAVRPKRERVTHNARRLSASCDPGAVERTVIMPPKARPGRRGRPKTAAALRAARLCGPGLIRVPRRLKHQLPRSTWKSSGGESGRAACRLDRGLPPTIQSVASVAEMYHRKNHSVAKRWQNAISRHKIARLSAGY